MSVGVLGLGSWGTAVATRLAARGYEVKGWTHDAQQREALGRDRENRKYLPGVSFPPSLTLVNSPEDAASDVMILGVPSHAVRELSREHAAVLQGSVVVNLAKGIEEGTHRRMLEILQEETGVQAVSLIGPSHAEEVVRNMPTALVAASLDARAAATVQDLVSDDTLRVYTNDDTVGVETAAALKNVIALAAGISAGLGLGDNTLGALLTRGLVEMTRLGVQLGARAETFYGLSGVGDLVTTCASRHSRNRRVGEAVGRGEPLEQVLAGMTMVAEGVRTTRAAKSLAATCGVEMPIVERVHAVLFAGEAPSDAIRKLMSREPKPEDPGSTSEGAR